MAKVLSEFPVAKGEAKYPWSSWLDGRPFELIPGEDFTAKVPTFIQSARMQAKRRNGNVRTRILGEGDDQRVVIQFRSEH